MAIPPLVDPAPELPPERASRYARTTQLPGFGMLAQRRLRNARVLVVGAGGLGSGVLPLLASAGFGTIGIVDDDRVELSNLPRQTVHTPADVGRAEGRRRRPKPSVRSTPTPMCVSTASG